MMSRYDTLEKASARNIKEYRDNGGKMQYITVFIDELADLLMSDKRIEKYLIRIAQLGRASGTESRLISAKVTWPALPVLMTVRMKPSWILK